MNQQIEIEIGTTMKDYNLFLECKKLPRYEVIGRKIITDTVSHAAVFGGNLKTIKLFKSDHLLDFQEDITKTAMLKTRYAAFLDCGLGKTAIELAWAHSVAAIGKVLILCPLSVFKQMIRECKRWYGHEPVNLRDRQKWTDGIAIMNFEGRRDIDMTGVSGVVLDESSILKNDTGETRNYLCELVKNVEYRLCASATPAPNDHDEYASHAVFLGLVKTSKEFYSKFFRKENNSWILKSHAIEPFYSNLATWATYLRKPSMIGYDHMTEMPCEPNYIYYRCGYDSEIGDTLFKSADNQKDRSFVFGPLRSNPESERTKAIIDWITGHRSITWCLRNNEESMLAKLYGKDCIVINGKMPVEERVEKVDAWRNGEIMHLVSKPSVLGFGINLPECERMVYSGFNYSFEQFYQAVRRAHRYGRNGQLDVLIPYTWPEQPILSVLRRKMETFEEDSIEMQRRFYKKKEASR